MKNYIKLAAIIIVMSVIQSDINAQLLNRLKKKTINKIENQIENLIVDEVSEEIARRAMKPIDKAFEQLLYSTYRKEYGEAHSDDHLDSLMQQSGADINQFLSALNEAADIPSAYHLDYHLVMESKEENGDKIISEMWFSETQATIALSGQEMDQHMIVIDMDNDVVVMYNENDGRKTAQAIPSMMSIASAYMAANDESFFAQGTQIEGPGKSKKIAGYLAQKYTIESDDNKGEYYVSSEVPINWSNLYANAMKQYSPKLYNAGTDQVKGMVLEGKFEDKKSKKKSSFKTKSIKEKKLVIDNADYEIRGITEQ